MANTKKTEMKKKKASNVRLTFNCHDDRPAILALQEIAAAWGVDGTEALRKTCVIAKEFMIDKAKQVKEVLKAS